MWPASQKELPTPELVERYGDGAVANDTHLTQLWQMKEFWSQFHPHFSRAFFCTKANRADLSSHVSAL